VRTDLLGEHETAGLIRSDATINRIEKIVQSRRTALKNIAGAIGASCGLGAVQGSGEAQPKDEKPNILCIVGEGLRSDEFSSQGNKILHTPNMDRIGREGCVFRNSFVVNALCLPSRATILTGLYSHTTGAVSNIQGKLPDKVHLLSDMLHQVGYETAFLGKSHIEGALKDHYWDYYFGFVGQADYYRPVITEGVRGKYSAPRLYAGEYVDTILTKHAIQWLAQPHEKPFCLFLWFYAPHAPFYRPKDLVLEFNAFPFQCPRLSMRTRTITKVSRAPWPMPIIRSDIRKSIPTTLAHWRSW
jgi:hypothetical protein